MRLKTDKQRLREKTCQHRVAVCLHHYHGSLTLHNRTRSNFFGSLNLVNLGKKHSLRKMLSQSSYCVKTLKIRKMKSIKLQNKAFIELTSVHQNGEKGKI